MFRPRANHPYADAARLPDEGRIDVAEALPGEGPLEIEIGPGRGGFLFERCDAAPEARLIGLEIRLKWAKIVDDRLRARGYGLRARVYNGDARVVLPRFEPEGCARAVFLHFPDPWWKKRHQKRLVMSSGLLDAIARVLVDGGELFVQTDVEERAALYEEQIGAHSAFAPSGDQAGSARLADNPYGARSPRERRAMADGLPINRLRFRRRLRASIDRS